MSEFLGSRISLISKSDIRYVGTLHEINSDESTVSLENVRSFGTEGRRGRPEEEIAPSEQVYEYIVFRGSDVKDLRIEEHPTIKENKPPAMPDDPAIVGVRARPRAQDPPQQNVPAGPASMPPPYPPSNFYGGPPPPGSWGRGGMMPGPQFGNVPYPPPPGWFPPGQAFPHEGPAGPGPGPWQNPPFPLRPGGPPVPEAQPGVPEAPPPGSAQDNKPPPIAPEAEKARPVPTAQVPPTEPKSLAPATRQPPHANTSAPLTGSKPSAEESGTVATALPSNGRTQATDAPKAAPSGPKNNRITPVMPLAGPAGKPFQPPFAEGKATQVAAKTTTTTGPSSVQDATNAARAAVAVAMAQLGNSGGSTMDNLTNKVNEMRVNAGRGNSAPGRGRGRGGRPAKVEVPDADFDFAQANAKFSKEEFVREAVGGPSSTEISNGTTTDGSAATTAPAPDTAAYNKSKSFFDNISSEARERAENHGQKPGGREWRGEEQRRNMETFGQGSVDGGYRHYRGRGRGRGRGNRGFGRGGGRGGLPAQHQSTTAAASQ